MSLLDDGKPMFVHINTGTKRMWWVMDDMETVRLFIATGKGWLEIPPEEWKMADTEQAKMLPDWAREECINDE
jgi:hypothetical protein